MGIKSLTHTIRKNSPDAITHENLYKLNGKIVAVDASLILYQQLLNTPGGRLFRNKEGKITNHLTGVFYKIMNYIALNIELIFVFDGKPPDNKAKCIQERINKSVNSKKKSENTDDPEKKEKYERNSIRLTKEMIYDVKQLLSLMGISYIHQDGEGEAIASELCRIGYVDYVLTEDMDAMVYGCPNMIRNCLDKSLKRKDIISIINYDKVIEGISLSHDKFIEFCILCGCDYCYPVPKIGNITALKLIKKYNTIENILEETKYAFPENYLENFYAAKENFMMFKGKLDINELKIYKSEKDITKLYAFLVGEIEMNEKRVQNALKKYHNNY
jgi:flap endonuclease-1